MFDETGISDDDVEHTRLSFDRRVQPVEIGQAGYVALNRRHLTADLGFGLVQFGLAAAGDEDMGTFRCEALGGCQTDTARSARDDGNFSCEMRHDVLL